jgi:hypothetical protein
MKRWIDEEGNNKLESLLTDNGFEIKQNNYIPDQDVQENL